VAQKFHFAILRIEVTRASRGLSAISELLVLLRLTFKFITDISYFATFHFQLNYSFNFVGRLGLVALGFIRLSIAVWG